MESSFILTGLVLHPDGSYVRHPIPTIPADPNFVDGVAIKDVTIDEKINLWVRIYQPETHEQKPLPVVMFYHGGGFLMLSADYPNFDKILKNICKKLGAIVVSANYRLAPEHRLPAAYDDSFAAVEWMKGAAKELNADLSKVFIMGDSAGGNIAHHVTVRMCQDKNLGLKPAGQILLQPFFGGNTLTPSEASLLTFSQMSDNCWRVTLPEGADKEHEYCNVPAKLRSCPELDLPRTLVVAGGKDSLRDREIEYVEVLRGLGKDAELIVYESAEHAFYVNVQREETIKLLEEIYAFINKCLN